MDELSKIKRSIQNMASKNRASLYTAKVTAVHGDVCDVDIEGLKLSERKGSVKEVFAVDDYTIDIKGVLIGHDGVLPCSQVQWLRDMYESKKSIELHNALTAYFLQEQKNVVITALNFYDQEAKDERHIPFSMTLISDYVETLEFI